jgi:hypothetical protein
VDNFSRCGIVVYSNFYYSVNAIYDKAHSKGGELGPDHVDVPKELTEADLALLPEKKRNKIINQRTRDAKKAADKAKREAMRATTKTLREATVAVEEEAKKVEKPRKSKAITPPLLLIETSYASPSEKPRKRAASVPQLSVSRLQQLASPSLMDSAGGGVACSVLVWFPTIH